MEEDFSEFTFDTERKVTDKVPTIIVVRHAESVANTQGIYQGQTYDTDLSELGKKQAGALAKRVSGLGISKVLASPLKRTHQTAQAVAVEAGCDIEVSEILIETNHGAWEGNHKDWIAKNYPEVYELWQKRPSEAIFPEGEAFIETVQRTLNFLDDTNFETNTLIVTHDNILRAMISLINSLDIDKMWDIPLETASLNYFEVNKINQKNLFRTLELNDIKHLMGLRNDVKIHAL